MLTITKNKRGNKNAEISRSTYRPQEPAREVIMKFLNEATRLHKVGGEVSNGLFLIYNVGEHFKKVKLREERWADTMHMQNVPDLLFNCAKFVQFLT